MTEVIPNGATLPVGTDTKTTEASATPIQPTRDQRDYARARNRIAELEKKLEQSEAAKKSEAERAVEEAYTRGKTETQTQADARLRQKQLENTITRKVLAAGLHEDAIDLALVKLQKLGIDDPTESEIGEVLATLEWAKSNPVAQQPPAPKVPGQPGAPSPADASRPEYPKGGVWSRDQIQEVIARGLYPTYKESIESARKTNAITGGIRIGGQ